MNRASFRIAAEDPCLVGHFPGNPIVPGVVVLERVIEAVAAQSGRRVAGIQRCKFAGPLRPGEACAIEWAPQDGALRFVCSGSGGVLARGLLTLAKEPEAPGG